MESLVLDITKLLLRNDVSIDERITLVPTAAPAGVPNNPAISDDQLEVFFDLDVKAV